VPSKPVSTQACGDSLQGDDLFENFDLALSLRKNNDIIVYYNAQENEIEYLYGQENDISVRQIEYRIIANSKSINTLVEDTTSGDYIVDIDDDPEDDIDIQAIVAQLQQVITLQRIATGLLFANDCAPS
jgi:hypothetical protein